MVVYLRETSNGPWAIQSRYLQGEMNEKKDTARVTETDPLGLVSCPHFTKGHWNEMTCSRSQSTKEVELAAKACLPGSTGPLFWNIFGCWFYPLLSEKNNKWLLLFGWLTLEDGEQIPAASQQLRTGCRTSLHSQLWRCQSDLGVRSHSYWTALKSLESAPHVSHSWQSPNDSHPSSLHVVFTPEPW